MKIDIIKLTKQEGGREGEREGGKTTRGSKREVKGKESEGVLKER